VASLRGWRGQHAVTIDAHPVGRFVRLLPACHEADGESGRAALRVLEVVDVAKDQHAAFSRVIEVPEVRLSIEE